MDNYATSTNINVFQATADDKENVWDEFEIGKWYYAEAGWKKFWGPYHSQEEAQSNFNAYLNNRRICPGCEE